MQRGGGVDAVHAGGPDDDKIPGLDRDGGKAPFREIDGSVRQAPLVEVDSCGGGIMDFNPVGIRTVLILDGGDVISHELTDDGVGFSG